MNTSLDAILKPRSIAVVGASRQPRTIGHQIVSNLLEHGFDGVVYPVNPSAKAVHSIAAYPRLGELPEVPDLAVIVVPKQHVLGVARDAAEAGVKGLVVISAGFKEVGGEGVERERELLRIVRDNDMRLVGPNCMGVLNSDPETGMNATFAPTMPPVGGTGFMSQSGAIGITILDYARELGIGVRHFVSIGNKPDVSGNDLLEYWEDDPDIRVVLMYIESFGNPRHFTRIARRVSKKKPIVVVKSGRSVAGARAASSHTGAMAAEDVASEALFESCGVLRADSIQELFDYARAFEALSVPGGNRVAIITNAGGPGIMIADACEAEGLDVTDFEPETSAALSAALPEEASVRNPVDMIASAPPQAYETVLDTVLRDPNVDCVIASFVPPLGVRQIDVARKILAAAERGPDKPIVAVLMGRDGLDEARDLLQSGGIPAYLFPEAAAKALGATVRYGDWLRRPLQEPVAFDVDSDAVRAILDRAVEEDRVRLLEPEALDVLDAYGIPTVPHRLVRDADEAARAAGEIGYPVVLKAVSYQIVHKSDVGGVRVDLRSEEELRDAIAGMRTRIESDAPGATLDGFLVTKMISKGRETILGMTSDPSFGPVLMFGLGGIYVEALADVAFGAHPLAENDALEMIDSIRGTKLLGAIRGEEAVDRKAIAEALQRISQLVEEHPRVMELDVNPCMVFGDGVLAVDGRIAINRRESRRR